MVYKGQECKKGGEGGSVATARGPIKKVVNFSASLARDGSVGVFGITWNPGKALWLAQQVAIVSSNTPT